MTNPYKNRDLRKFLKSIPRETVERVNKKQLERNQKMHAEFLVDLNRGICFLCKREMDTFFPKRFCLHWFTYPTGIRKKHFSAHLNGELNYSRVDAYFRWLANSEALIVNINDLTEEVSSTSYIETTIRYKNIEWAISIGHTDKEGHKNGKMGDRPHYHIQMKVNERIFLRFNDFHIRFTDTDLFNFELKEQAGDMFEARAYQGDGISILENEERLQYIEKHSMVADDVSVAPFNRQTFIMAALGETISGDLIADAAEESQRTKEPVGRILQRLLPNAGITTLISPGEGVPEMTKRSGKD